MNLVQWKEEKKPSQRDLFGFYLFQFCLFAAVLCSRFPLRLYQNQDFHIPQAAAKKIAI